MTQAVGRPYPGFMADAGRCWRMVYDHNLQAAHCLEQPSWTGGPLFRAPRRAMVAGLGVPEHLEGLTGLREFGRGRKL